MPSALPIVHSLRGFTATQPLCVPPARRPATGLTTAGADDLQGKVSRKEEREENV